MKRHLIGFLTKKKIEKSRSLYIDIVYILLAVKHVFLSRESRGLEASGLDRQLKDPISGLSPDHWVVSRSVFAPWNHERVRKEVVERFARIPDPFT